MQENGRAPCNLLTAIPGSSDVFVGGVIAYYATTKVELLDVTPAKLKAPRRLLRPDRARKMVAQARAAMEHRLPLQSRVSPLRRRQATRAES